MQRWVLVSFMIRKSYCRTVYDLMFCAVYGEAKKHSRCQKEREEMREELYIEDNEKLFIFSSL